ncbi:hypothetical protein WJX84_008708, partial [Apatococcus fuscideae]
MHCPLAVASLPINLLHIRSTSTTEPFSSLDHDPLAAAVAADEAENDNMDCCGPAHNWSHLPDDVLKHIFGQLQPASLRGIRLVCTAWHRTVSRFIVSLQPESFRGSQLGRQFPYLQVLDLRHADTCITQEGGALGLQSLLADADLEQLAHLPASLRSLQLGNSPHIFGP